MEFYLERDEDPSGISGTGKIAQGVVFDDGRVSLRWLTEHNSTVVYDSLVTVYELHGHGGKTRLVPIGCYLAVVHWKYMGAMINGFQYLPGGGVRSMHGEWNQRKGCHDFFSVKSGEGDPLVNLWTSINAGLIERGTGSISEDEIWGVMPPKTGRSSDNVWGELRSVLAKEGVEAGKVLELLLGAPEGEAEKLRQYVAGSGVFR